MNTADLLAWLAVARRHPLSVLCAVIVFVCAVGSLSLYRDLRSLEFEERQLSQDGDLKIAALTTGPAIRQELEAAREVTRKIDSNLVSEDDLGGNLWYFYKIEQQTKARLADLHQLNTLVGDSRSTYRRVPYSLRVTGTYDQTAAFLYAIETGPRLANVTSMNYRRREPGSPTLVMDLNLELLANK